MLSPRDVNPGSTTPCWTAQDIDAAPATALQAKTGKARASASPTLNTSMLILRLIRNNRILSAMTAFTEHMNASSLPPFTHDQLEAIIVALRIQSRRHASARPTPKQQAAAVHAELWRPSRLDPSISAKSLPIPVQCMYAMSAVYDVSIEQKHRPTAKMVSAMLATFATTLAPEQLLQAAHTAIQHLFPATITSPRRLGVFWRYISHRALSTFIRVFGRAGVPEEGEEFLRQWTRAQRAAAPQQPDAAMLQADITLDLAGWGSNIVVWQSLINARVDAGHLAEARKWLDRYRHATKQLSAAATGDDAAKALPIRPEPYLAYMAGVRNSARNLRSVGHIRRVLSSTHDVVRLMAADHVPIESSVLAFVLDCDARLGHVDGGASLLHELGDLIRTMALADPALLRSLLHMRRAVVSNTSSGGARSHLSNLPSTRSLIRSLVRVGEGETPASRDHIAECRSRGMLNDALITVMAERDYPAAVAVLNLFERWMITVSQTTYSIVLTSLIAHGHHDALRGEAAQATRSDSVYSLEATLQSMAREGNGEQAHTIRRALGDQVLHSDTFLASAQPATPLRKTQYLVRILNRVCAAEIEAVESQEQLPAWAARVTAMQTQHWKDDVRSVVAKAITGAQTGLLGHKDARKQRIAGPAKAPLLFAAAPRLSPKRKHLTAAPATWSRELSTSAAARQTAAPSCDLAASAKGDYTHLEPVRTVYIPGFVPYDLGLALQEHLVQERAQARQALRALDDASSTSASVRAGLTLVSASASEAALRAQAAQDTLLLLQHRPVYTEGRREESENFDVAEALRALGADYKLTKRGGQITYHGPGQLVGYPILNLGAMGLASRCYVDRVQDSLISLLATRGIGTVDPPDAHTGVWADEYHKIASIGIQVRHRVSSHGFALNVEQRAMRGFRHIVACGIVGKSMTCVHDRLDPTGPFARYNSGQQGDKDESVESVASDYVRHFANVFKRTTRQATQEEMSFELAPEDKAAVMRQRLGIHVAHDEQVVQAIRVGHHRVQVA